MKNSFRSCLAISGVVQGVGFRPFVYRLASQRGLGGWVQNRSGSVLIEVRGAPEEIGGFLEALRLEAPPGCRIDRIEELERAPDDQHEVEPFRIVASEHSSDYAVSFPADLAICPECRRELLDAGNRRYRYAFTTCTACGPRYTVIDGMPYDRERTTLRAFPLCAECRHEYDDPSGRRFHAESIACPACGPALRLLDAAGAPLSVSDPIMSARAQLGHGAVVAVRGIGGFVLAVDAANREAIRRLRAVKERPEKPLAVMFRNGEVLRRYCAPSTEALEMLEGSAAPIVICEGTAAGRRELAWSGISPETGAIGAMLPSAPLHVLLFESLGGDPVPAFDALIMTSGNRRSEPICISDREAFDRLGGIADLFLTHNREINLRADDSVLRDRPGQGLQLWRRARGFVPSSLALPAPLARTTLALGAHFKNAAALGYGDRAVFSPHIGDLETPEARSGLDRAVIDLEQLLDCPAAGVACDLHPDFYSSRVAHRLAKERGLPVTPVQHHAAHAAACLVEHGRTRGLVLVFDGTGYGTDGAIWGAELIALEGRTWRRLASFCPAALPGGDRCVRAPYRQLAARVLSEGFPGQDRVLAAMPSDEVRTIRWQIERGANSPLSHAAGRLFDSVSAALGFSPELVSYEGQAAVCLETAAVAAESARFDPARWFALKEQESLLLVDWRSGLDVCSAQLLNSRNPAAAREFHAAVAHAALEMVRHGRRLTGETSVGLSGGCFMNPVLSAGTEQLLVQEGMEVLQHRMVPPNDGGIALGQLWLGGE